MEWRELDKYNQVAVGSAKNKPVCLAETTVNGGFKGKMGSQKAHAMAARAALPYIAAYPSVGTNIPLGSRLRFMNMQWEQKERGDTNQRLCAEDGVAHANRAYGTVHHCPKFATPLMIHSARLGHEQHLTQLPPRSDSSVSLQQWCRRLFH